MRRLPVALIHAVITGGVAAATTIGAISPAAAMRMERPLESRRLLHRTAQADRAELAAEAERATRTEPDAKAVWLDKPVRQSAAELSIADAIRLGLASNPLARAQKLEVDAAQVDVDQIESRRYLPQLRLGARSGVVPEARGDVLFSPDKADDLGGLGPFVQFELQAIEPLYTFGKLANAVRVARSGLLAQSSKRDALHNELVVQIVKSYWGLAAAISAREVAEEMRQSYTTLLEEVRERLQDVSSEIDDTDVFEVESRGFDIEKLYLESIDRVELLGEALNLLVGRDVGSTVTVSEAPPPVLETDAEVLPELVAKAGQINPQLRAVTSLVAALDARMDLQNSQRLPTVFLAAGFSVARAGNRVDQTNPFVLDEFNYRRVGLHLGLQWDLNFVRHNLEYQKAKIERDAAAARAEALRGKMMLDVHRAFRDAAKNQALVEEARRSRRSANRWLRLAFDNWDLGIGEIERLLKAYEASYRLQGQAIEREYELNVSLGRLAVAIGDSDLYLQWIDDGKVALD